MDKKFVIAEKKLENNGHSIKITYYFTAVFSILGTLAVLYLLNLKVDKVNLFVILLSITAGGLPIGFIGAFIDYKKSEFILKRASES